VSTSPVVTLRQVRYEIGDQPKLNVAAGGMELLTPTPADGITTVFPLRFTNANLTTVTLFTQAPAAPSATVPGGQPIYTPVPAGGITGNAPVPAWSASSDANGNPIVIFATPPALGLIIGARYQVTAFPDDILNAILLDNQRSTATLTLKAVHYAVIPMILADQQRLTIYRLGDRTDDLTAFITAQTALMKALATMLDDEPGEGPSSYGSSYLGGGWGGW